MSSLTNIIMGLKECKNLALKDDFTEISYLKLNHSKVSNKLKYRQDNQSLKMIMVNQ